MRALGLLFAVLSALAGPVRAAALMVPADVAVSRVGAQTVGNTTIYASTQLAVAWTPPPDATIDHYVVVASESVMNTSVSTAAPGTATGATLSGLKAATSYSVTVKACADSPCGVAATSSAASGSTFAEVWQLQGSGNTVGGLMRIVGDGNARISATRFGAEAGGDPAPRIQLYYGPSGSQTQKLVVATTTAGTDAANPASYLSFQSLATSSGLASPPTATPLVGSVATGQAVPLSAALGGKVRLFFEAEGSDHKTRIMSVDSRDGYAGRDFNAGSALACSTSADYQSGGGCAPAVAIGVEGDAVLANAKIANARQFKLGYPILDDWRWDGAVGTFMVFTTGQVSGCSSAGTNHGYAVWDGSRWNVQYETGGCPKLFTNAQAAFPLHVGGSRYKLYYGDPSLTTGRLNSSLPFLGPKKLIYADGAISGAATNVDFEDWEAQSAARDVVFLWPNGDQLDATAEGYIDDFHFLSPTGSLGLQVMYMAITDGAQVPIGAAAVLLNPGQEAAAAQPVYRFNDTRAGTHFYTASEAEKAAVLASYPWFVLEGTAFYAFAAAGSGLVPIYRFNDSLTGAHFYTGSEAEKNAIIASYPWFAFEGIGYYASPAAGAGLVPLYRFNNTRAGVHFYTASEAEKDIVVASYPWLVLEGIAYYVRSQP